MISQTKKQTIPILNLTTPKKY